jgi:predicted Zn-dependent protease
MMTELNNIASNPKYIAALQHNAAGNFGNAEMLFLELLDENPENTDLLQKVSNTLLRAQKFREAIPHLTRYVELAPEHALAYCALGHAQRTIGDTISAISNFRNALKYETALLQAHTALP